MDEEHRHLDKPINGALRNLKNTQSREEEESMHQKRDLSCNYGLRENPKKKTQKSFGLESPELMKKILFRCGECGKGFRYEKCLSNHQAGMHLSTNQRVYEESIKSLCSSFSLVRKKKRSRVIRYKNTSLSCSFATFLESPSVSAAANDEELEVAECLILLSKRSPKFVVDGLKLVGEAMDAKNPEMPRDCVLEKPPKAGEFESGVLSDERKLLKEETSSDETSKEPASFLGIKCELDQRKLRTSGGFGTWKQPASFLGEKSEMDQWKLQKSCDFECGFYRTELGVGATKCSDSDTEIVTESGKRNVEHQCRLCNKTFSSYQALGGHQTFHRMSESRNKKNCREVSVEEPEDESVTVKKEKKRHNCSIRSRRFRSVHALGGHKTCHGKRQHAKTEHGEDLGILSAVAPVTVGIELY
ncbi:unnamed protein product [Thlaspi arvense]|uniref:C2H2-type domain-containing protein n=1 Tax=Thlaspi arvense TaxID=13288 RepID=A0AAU9STQ2_THLAR|nr:unnamed protein product [Thlaspi arvense]